MYNTHINHKNVIFKFVKFMFSKKATKIDEISTVDLTLCSKVGIFWEDHKIWKNLPLKISKYIHEAEELW